MKKIVFLAITALFLTGPFLYAKGHSHLSFTEYQDYYQLDNGLISLQLSKQGDVLALIKDDINLVTNLSGVSRDPNKHRSFYLDYHTGISGGATNFYPTTIRIIEQNERTIHIAFVGSAEDHVYLEYHYIMKPNVSGIYNYVVAENKSQPEMRLAELRTVYHFDPSLLNKIYNGNRVGEVPLYADLEERELIQDETWRLDNGDIYSKYDYAAYMRESKVWGALGNGYGAWLIPASHDYYAGDALNQELLVHQDAIVLNYLTGAHLGSPDMFAPHQWQKLYGPWLLYVNHEPNQHALLGDAYQQAKLERKQWPYKWLKDDRYAVSRGSLKGSVSAESPMMVVLSSDSVGEFDQQTLGYFYSAQTDKHGRYHIKDIKPGQYTLSAYALGGNQIGTLYQDVVDIEAGKAVKNIVIPEALEDTVWHIGYANRRADEFRNADKPRNYIWKDESPANLDYNVVNSNEAEDWYFVQSQPGTWTVNFNLDTVKASTLNLALAATSNGGMRNASAPQLAIFVNGKPLQTFKYKNDKAIYRSALQSGRYTAEKLSVPAEYFQLGDNTIEFRLIGGSIMYDTINLSR